MVDSADRLYLAGSTSSPTFPVTTNAYQKSGGGPSGINASGFVMRISGAGDAFHFSTYLGAADSTCVQCQTSLQDMFVDGHGITIAGTTLPATMWVGN